MVLLCLGLTSSATGQQLRPVEPRWGNINLNGVDVGAERGIPRSTVAAMSIFLKANLKGFEFNWFALNRMPGSSEQFLVFVSDFEGGKNYLVLLRKHGDGITEDGRIERDGGPIYAPHFFVGQDRVLLLITNGYADGGFVGTWALEYRGEKLTQMKDIEVYDQIPNNIGMAPRFVSAKYRQDAYFVTLRGSGVLHSGGGDHDRIIARKGVALTLTYKQDAWVSPGK